MKPRIAIPQPHSKKPDYNARALPQYVQAIAASGGEAVEVSLSLSNEEIAKLISTCQGVVLPGSPADVDPQKFGAAKHPKTNAGDPARDNVDELLLQDAFNMRKPVFGICYGLQSLNVWRSGTLVQHIETSVNHEAGSKVQHAHPVEFEKHSKFGEIAKPLGGERQLPVNSSHHQSAEIVGDGLSVVACSPQDNVIEAIEGTRNDHFVLAVQWHPERNFEADPLSQALFRRLIEEAAEWRAR